MAKISKNGHGKTLYIELSIYPCGGADPEKNLTISCPAGDTKFKGLSGFPKRFNNGNQVS